MGKKFSKKKEINFRKTNLKESNITTYEYSAS